MNLDLSAEEVSYSVGCAGAGRQLNRPIQISDYSCSGTEVIMKNFFHTTTVVPYGPLGQAFPGTSIDR